MRRRDVRGSRAPCQRYPGAHRSRSSARRQPRAAGLPRGRGRNPMWSEPARSWPHGTPSQVRRDELHKPHAASRRSAIPLQFARSSMSTSGSTTRCGPRAGTRTTSSPRRSTSSCASPVERPPTSEPEHAHRHLATERAPLTSIMGAHGAASPHNSRLGRRRRRFPAQWSLGPAADEPLQRSLGELA